MPSGRVLKKEGCHYSLTVPFDSQLEKADTVELVVRVILPEYAKNVHFVLPEGVSEPTLDHRWERWGGVRRRFTYLDSSLEGRPVYEFKKQNGVGENDVVTVSYELSGVQLMRKPMVCIGAFSLVFVVKAVLKQLRKEKRD